MLLKALGNKKNSASGSRISYSNNFKINLSLCYEILSPMNEQKDSYWCKLNQDVIHKVISSLTEKLI